MPDANILWLPAPAELRLVDNEVHVFAARLDLPPDQLTQYATTLSASEKERAAKFKFDKHRNRFIAGRGMLRELLGRYLNTEPRKLEFSYSERGKPLLAHPFSESGIHFNLAHSEDLALLAVTHANEIGVDIERIRPVKDVDDLVARFFSKRESELFQKLPEADKPIAFFNLWTRKEALLKATGEGIGSSLNKVEVSFLANEPARLLAIGGNSTAATKWSLQTLSPAAGFVGAVAIRAVEIRLVTSATTA